jgi:hypothetical protein
LVSLYFLLLGEQGEGPEEREGSQGRRGGRRQGAARTQATVQGRNRYFATLLAIKLQVRIRYCHIAGTQASGQKQILSHLLALKHHFKAETGVATLLALKLQVRSQVMPHCWHSSFRPEADIVTTARTQATVQGRNRYCHIAGTQASGQKKILSQLLALNQ